MGNDSFRFKQFAINQNICAMKVGTDGVALGAWANPSGCTKILDAGTGTGLIALMMAQRNSLARIDAIDIDADACRQAGENVAASPFSARIRVINKSLSAFMDTESNDKAYNLIVSNPPYFTDSLKSPDSKRNSARHADSLTLEELIISGRRLLSPTGRLALILPFDREDELRGIAVSNRLNPTRMAQLSHKEGSSPKRLLAELSTDFSIPCIKEAISIMTAQGQYTSTYARMTEDFFIR